MRPRQKLMVFTLVCAAVVMGLLLASFVSIHLLANREMVKSIIVTKAAQATGSSLDYDRLEVIFFPLPHLQVSDLHLHRKDTLRMRADELSVYPRVLPILTGRFIIRRLELIAANTTVGLDSKTGSPPGHPGKKIGRPLRSSIRAAVTGLFGALTGIDPDTELHISKGSLTLALSNSPDIQIGDIDALVANEAGRLSLNLKCRSAFFGNLAFSGKADVDTLTASGKITIGDINLRPLLAYATLPGGIGFEKTRVGVEATVSIDGPETLRSRFYLRCPSLTVKRNSRQLDLKMLAIGGTLTYADKRLALSLDTLKSNQPPLDFSANASVTAADEDANRSIIEVNAATRQLDVAVAGQVTRAIAGDLDGIRTAFSVAKEGRLTDATYFAGFDVDESGWHLKKMKATGYLARGRVAIPDIEADLEGMDGDVIYEDKKVAFKQFSGHFKGATFDQLDAAIDWDKEATLTISSPSIIVDAAPFYTWLTSLEGLNKIRAHLASVTGKGHITELKISGPLTKPKEWALQISGTPEDCRLTSPLVPFEIRTSGGKISIKPGQEQAEGLRVDFLDGSFIANFQTKGITNPQAIRSRIDGSMGQATINWLSTIIPIPTHLQIKPPVNLAGVDIAWDNTDTLSFTGELKTAGGVTLWTDSTRSPKVWHIRKLYFSDSRSEATVSARLQDNTLELAFSGNVEQPTADRLLKENRILSGRLEGDFRSVIDIAAPLNSTFAGKLSGEGLHLRSIVRDPIELKHFAIDGHDNQLKIASSKISLLNSLMVVDGLLKRNDGSLIFDLNVDADRIDEALIRALQPAAEDSALPRASQEPPATFIPRGNIHLKATDFTYGRFTWSPLEADIKIDDDQINIRVDEAKLCGISTTGDIEFSPRGLAFTINPAAKDASLQQTDQCLWQIPKEIDATYDLSGVIKLPPTLENPIQLVSGRLDFLSMNGRIVHTNVWTEIISFLDLSHILADGKADNTEKGFVYTKAHIKSEIGAGKMHFKEILLDGKSMKIAGQGSIDLNDNTVDIVLLVAPLQFVDRLIFQLPVISNITGGTLISIPLQLEGKIDDIKVVSLSPANVGQGLLNSMGRVLEKPFRMVEASPDIPPADTNQKGP